MKAIQLYINCSAYIYSMERVSKLAYRASVQVIGAEADLYLKGETGLSWGKQHPSWSLSCRIPYSTNYRACISLIDSYICRLKRLVRDASLFRVGRKAIRGKGREIKKATATVWPSSPTRRHKTSLFNNYLFTAISTTGTPEKMCFGGTDSLDTWEYIKK